MNEREKLAEEFMQRLEGEGLTVTSLGAGVTGLDLIFTERMRQLAVEGYTLEHDKRNSCVEDLVKAAICYAVDPRERDLSPLPFTADDGSPYRAIPSLWPFAASAWKPSTYKRDLVKAGALIVAALDLINICNDEAYCGRVEMVYGMLKNKCMEG